MASSLRVSTAFLLSGYPNSLTPARAARNNISRIARLPGRSVRQSEAS
jgi:hypothetical protein